MTRDPASGLLAPDQPERVYERALSEGPRIVQRMTSRREEVPWRVQCPRFSGWAARKRHSRCMIATIHLVAQTRDVLATTAMGALPMKHVFHTHTACC